VPTLLVGYDVEAPNPALTGAFLAQMRAVHRDLQAPASLFLVGRAVEHSVAALRPVAENPLFDVQRHTYSHVHTLLPASEMKQAFTGALRHGRPPLSHAFVDSLDLRGLFDPILNTMWDGTATISAALQNTQTAVTAALAPNVGKRVCVTGAATGVC